VISKRKQLRLVVLWHTAFAQSVSSPRSNAHRVTGSREVDDTDGNQGTDPRDGVSGPTQSGGGDGGQIGIDAACHTLTA